MKKQIRVLFIMTTIFGLVLFSASCGGDKSKVSLPKANDGSAAPNRDELAKSDPQGIGKYRDMQLNAALDKTMAKDGAVVYDVKCLACHKLTEEKLVGPGWKGVTERRRPEWVLNFVTNVEEMLDKDSDAKAMLELCMVRMPNQSLTDKEARDVLEYMRENDGLK